MKFKNKLLFVLAALGMVATSCSNKNNNNYVPINDDALTPIHFVYKNDKTGADDDDYLYYSDDYFRQSSTTYNPHLATLSIYMSKYSQNPGNPDSLDDEYWFTHQSERVEKFLEAIGFDNFACNDDYMSRTSFDTIGVAVASRKIDDNTLLACTVRSGGYFNEWENNVFLGDGSQSDMMHEGWYNAANKVIAFLGQYIQNKNINGHIKLWMSGFSRGGATINIAAGLLDNKIAHQGGDQTLPNVTIEKGGLYAYTFEAPQGANTESSSVDRPDTDTYNNIFNIVNPTDMVTKVAMSSMHFTRFGIDKFITTQFFDYDNFNNNRLTAQMLYGKNNTWPADKFQMHGIPFSKFADLYNIPGLVADVVDWIIDDQQGGIPIIFEHDETKVNYDPNILMTLILDEACEVMDRNYYAEYVQDVARSVMKQTMSDFKDPNTLPTWAFFTEIAFQAIAKELFGDNFTIFDLVTQTGVTTEQAGKTLDVAAHVFEVYPNEFETLIANASDIFHNHDTAVNVAHLMAQDSYYVDAYNKGRSPQQGTIELVPLLDTTSYCRFHLYDFNDCHLYTAEDNYSSAKVSISGQAYGASIVGDVAGGYAAGYYHYSDYERINIFFNPRFDHTLNLAEYSVDDDHHCYAEWYFYNTIIRPIDGRIYFMEDKFYDDEHVTFGIEEFSKSYEAPEKSADPTITDLTNTTWVIEHLRVELPQTPMHVNFTETVDGIEHESISCIYDSETTRFELYYDEEKVAYADAYDETQTLHWMGGAGHRATIKFTGGTFVRDAHLIEWCYRCAELVQ